MIGQTVPTVLSTDSLFPRDPESLCKRPLTFNPLQHIRPVAGDARRQVRGCRSLFQDKVLILILAPPGDSSSSSHRLHDRHTFTIPTMRLGRCRNVGPWLDGDCVRAMM